MTIHEQVRTRFIELGDKLPTLTVGSEEHQKAVEEYGKLYKLLLDHEKLDEDVMDRRAKMEDDLKRLEMELSRDKDQRKHERNMKLLGLGGLLAAFTGGIALENRGLLVPKMNDFLRRV